ERGQPDVQPADEISRRVFRGSAVRCVVLSACHTGEAAASGLAGQLVKAGVPIVLGGGTAVGDDAATTLGTYFYKFLGAGENVPAAAAKARDELWRKQRARKGDFELWDPTFALVRIYAAGPGLALVDHANPAREYRGPRTRPTLIDGKIKGLKEGFIGRRRVQ